jgi:hypothetical protein
MIWWGRIPVHRGLPRGLAGLPAWYRKLMSSAGIAAGFNVAGGGGVRPPFRPVQHVRDQAQPLQLIPVVAPPTAARVAGGAR